MAVGYRNSAGVDFDDLFQPGTTQATGFRKSDGADLRYEPRGTTAKIPDVGYRDSLGSDLSNLWMAKGLAPPVPGFDGKTYRSSASAPTGATGNTSAEIRLTMNFDGTWAVRAVRVNAVDAGTVILASGVWLPAGASPGDFTVQYAVGSGTGEGIVTNGAAVPSSLSSSRTVSLTSVVLSASSNVTADERYVTTTLTRVGGGSSTALTLIGASAAGFV